MNTCRSCQIKIGEGFKKCPICGALQPLCDRNASLYPVARRRGTLLFWRKIGIGLLLLGVLSSAIVNICVGGAPWAVYVLLGAYAAYEIFLSLETAEISIIRRIVSGGYAVAFLLFGIERFTHSGTWAREIAIPMVLFGVLTASAALYASAYRKFPGHFLPVFGLCFLSMGWGIMGILGIWTIRWPLITLSSTALGVFVAALIIFHRRIWAELRKKLHI